jgi:tetratricopeptide (TPR) repeat protein
MMVMYQTHDYGRILQHYDRALSNYPRCALVEIWVAHQVVRRLGDFWRARQICRRAIELAPDLPHAYADMGFVHFLLGDFPGALSWFDQATHRATEADAELAARTYYNRGVARYYLDRDRSGAIADMQEAVRHNPDDAEAAQMLQQLRGKQEGRGTPWQRMVP